MLEGVFINRTSKIVGCMCYQTGGCGKHCFCSIVYCLFCLLAVTQNITINRSIDTPVHSKVFFRYTIIT